ncbi:GNAT family N-acetyltransferase [Paenalkalicoccus suaedae]|uniref:GNAT family N-acetyltransferase n=1 Tax=Paenalkalicoccus suaedae TaxID=2592382 RepID=A0A859FEK4_9BACI|nr:GNAT family N-acetyltransferase [Paenalkalicoccus suaedae]QKS71783.1 GNAT family N-acetyltransferase [Paenalkalicoccus suaedae]
MEVRRITKPVTDETIHKMTDLMMEQMSQLSHPISFDSLKQTITEACNDYSQAEFFIAQEGEEIVGCAFLNKGISLDKGGSYIWLNDLYVKLDYRQQGIAKKILLKVLYWAEQEQFKGIELETGINNEATKRLYNALGFYDIISKRYGRQL